MFCKNCGKEIPDDSKLCPYCGAVSPEEKTKAPKKAAPKKKHTGAVIVAVLLLLIALAIAAYFVSYNNAKTAAINGDFEKAKSSLVAPKITGFHDKTLLDYIDAGLLLQNKDYLGAYKAFKTLSAEDYLDSQQKVDDIKDTIYPIAVSMFEDGDKTLVDEAYFDNSEDTTVLHPERNYLYYQYLKLLKGYKDADWYMTYAKAPSGDLNAEEYKTILTDLDSKDKEIEEGAKEAMMMHIKVAERFLLGAWYTEDGKEYFEMKDDGDTLYTLPYPPNDDDKYFYSIVDGLYFNYLKEIAPSSLTQEDMEEGAFFDFEIVDKNTIDVYCYQDGNTYRMYRQERLP